MKNKASGIHTKKTQPEYLHNMHFKSLPVDKNRLFDKVIYRMMQENPERKVKGVSILWKYSSIAAAIALLFVCTYYLFLSGEMIQPAQSETTLAYMEISSVQGSKTKLILPDSSIVWLNGNSTIRYPHQFTGTKRHVNIKGEAMFDVTENKEKPFIVDVDGIEIKVLGTVFNVLAAPDAHIVETTLIEGFVELHMRKGDKIERLCSLHPNQQAIYNRESGGLDVLSVNANAFSSWVTGHYHFEKNNFEEICCILERAFNIKIHIANESLKKQRFNARFTHQESLEEILLLLQIPNRYKFKREKGEIHIY